jgi:DNA-binding PadR family transcriptional regulator
MSMEEKGGVAGAAPVGSAIEALLPLQPMHFRVSLVLAGGPMHGYAIAKELERAHGSPVLPGNLYRTLKQMRAKGLIQETELTIDNDDERRRYFELTALGQEVAAAETRRMEGLVEAAHRVHLSAPRKESAS